MCHQAWFCDFPLKWTQHLLHRATVGFNKGTTLCRIGEDNMNQAHSGFVSWNYDIKALNPPRGMCLLAL